MKKTWIVVALIIILGIFLRVYRLGEVSLYGDELTIGYDAYSLLKTAHDQTGAFLPLTFAMGAGRPAGYVYASVPFVALLGPTEWGVRALSLISGVGIMLLMFLLGRKISLQVGVTACLLTALSLWDINLSRGGFESHFALLLTLLGVFCVITAFRKRWLLPVAAVLFGIAIHTYPTFKLSLAFLVPALFVFLRQWKTWWRQKLPLVFAVVILGLFVVLAATQTLTAGSENRFERINALALPDSQMALDQKISTDRMLAEESLGAKRFFFNKAVENFSLVGNAYLKNLSLEFLAINGDSNPRHNMTQYGAFYYVELFSILLGILSLWSGQITAKGKRLLLFLFGWILIAPLPTALLLEPHFLRDSLLFPPLTILSACGFYFLWQRSRMWGRLTLFILILGLVIQLTFALNRLYFLSPAEFSRFWSYPAKKAAQLALAKRSNYDYIILSDKIDNLEYAYPVYAQVNPPQVIAQNHNRTTLQIRRFKKLANVYIGSIPSSEVFVFLNSLPGKVLYLGPVEDRLSLTNFTVEKNRDGLDAFVVASK